MEDSLEYTSHLTVVTSVNWDWSNEEAEQYARIMLSSLLIQCQDPSVTCKKSV